MNKKAWIILGIAIILLGGLFVYSKKTSSPSGQNTNATSTISMPNSDTEDSATSTVVTIKPYGQVKLALNQTANYPGGYIRIVSIDEDSRCATGVQCIWAGTVKTILEYSLNGITKRETLELNKSITRGEEKITLVGVEPANIAGKEIVDADYRFTLSVTKAASANSNAGIPVASGGCYVGGCSSQICSDDPGVVSDCMYRKEYACYKTAKCERQSNGQCGWTETAELKMCLANAR
jgi:hypothetical protein